MLLALSFYATCGFQNLVGDSIGVHKSTISRVIYRVSLVLAQELPNYVTFPVDKEVMKSKIDKFYEIAEFSGIIGCADGTQTVFKLLNLEGYEYVNRKGYHTLNVQLMCNAECKIISCVVKWPSSTHNSRILKEIAVYREFEDGLHEGIILGECGFL